MSPFTAIRTPPPLRSPSLRKTLKFERNSSEEKTEASKCVSVTAIILHFLVKPSASRMGAFFTKLLALKKAILRQFTGPGFEEISPHSKSLRTNEVRRPNS